ncbi:HAMP domain-containing sensor histidine kinase [Halostreptopolyspora alba]|uniref:histidine kinase n=1 Tax=Halostreptopolyspora alba TaxID=2487137 RepID=A0A3N0E164_9ACTN|nr:sensor histidine kinase [Nocardiopsaceae bacterium YIM 96095]
MTERTPNAKARRSRLPAWRSWSELRLGTKFAVSFALVAAAVVVLVGALAYNTAAFLVRADAQEEFDTTVEGIASDLRERPHQPPDEGTLSFVHSDTFTFQGVAPDGGVTVPVTNRDEPEPLPVEVEDRDVAAESAPGVVRTREDTANDEQYRIATVSIGDGRGAIQVGQRLSPVEQLLDRLALQMFWVALVVLTGAGLAGWLVGRRVTGRLVRLTETAEYVSSTGRLDLGAQDGERAGGDEVGRLGKAFNTMLERLAAAREEQHRLVQNASHELRTPLTSLRTNVSVMRRFDRLSPEAREQLVEDLQGETRELTDLVNELVELATERRENEPWQHVALGEVAEHAADRARRRTGRDVVVDADGTAVRGRPQALERAIANPVENAAKFDAEGTTPIEVVVREGRVEVRDRGPGFDPAELEHVFERFYRATSARSLPGSGLGLSMVQEVAREHGGDVFAHNREDGGAVVGFALPEERPEDGGPGRPGGEEPGRSDSGAGQYWARPPE